MAARASSRVLRHERVGIVRLTLDLLYAPLTFL
jgi:hypothetical protein